MKLERLLAGQHQSRDGQHASRDGQHASRDGCEDATRPSTTEATMHHQCSALATSPAPAIGPEMAVQQHSLPGQPVTATACSPTGVNTGCCMMQAPFVTTTAVTWSSSVVPNKLTVSSLLHMRDTKRQTKHGLDAKGISKFQSARHPPSTTAVASDIYDFKDDDDDDEKPSLQRRFDRRLPTPQSTVVSGAPTWTPTEQNVVRKADIDGDRTGGGEEQKNDTTTSTVIAGVSMNDRTTSTTVSLSTSTAAAVALSTAVSSSVDQFMASNVHQWEPDWADKSRDRSFDVDISGAQPQHTAAPVVARQTDQQTDRQTDRRTDQQCEVTLKQDTASPFRAVTQPTTGSVFRGRDTTFVPSQPWTGINAVDYNTSVCSAGMVPGTCFPPITATCQVPVYPAQTQSVYSSASINSAMDTFIAALEKEAKRTTVSSAPTAFPPTAFPPTSQLPTHPHTHAAPYDGVPGGMWPLGMGGQGGEGVAVVDDCKLDMSREDQQRVSEALTVEECELLARLRKNNVEEVPQCNCVGARKFI